MARKRLTARDGDRRAVEENTPYPGNVNQPDRKFKRREQYDIDWETTNHPYPDMRTEWRGDSRDEIGFGIPDASTPTVASVRVAANKAVRLAVLLLGDKVGDEVIEAQARDLMAMSQTSMDRTLERFAETQELYASDDGDEDDKGGDSDPDESKEAGEMPPQFKENAEKKKEEAKDKKDDSKDESKKAEDDEEDKDEESKDASDEPKKAEEAVEEPKKAEDDKEEDKKDEESKDASDESEEPKKAEDDEEDKDEESKEASEEIVLDEGRKSGEFDIELGSAVADEAEPDPEADARLAAVLFNDEPAVAAPEPKKAKEKTGIKKLGGQPRVASSEGSADISDIWASAPDVSDVFC